jgi:uncharacterized protein (TIGR02996 family)
LTEQELLAAVLAAPDELAPRLVYADWLQERGDPRGEFIAAQCRLRDMGPSLERDALREREQELLAAHEEEWLAELGLLMSEASFLCGLVEVVRLTGASLVRLAPTLRARAPVRALRLFAEPGPLPLLGPSLRALPGLRLLVASDVGVDDEHLEELAEAEALPRLTRLVLDHNRIGDRGARALAGSAWLGDLVLLRLSHNRLTASGARALGQSAHLESLAALVLDHNPLGDDGARALAEATGLPALTRLSLDSDGIGPDGARALASSSALARLTSLDLSSNVLGSTGARALAESEALSGLAQLRVAGNQLGGSALAGLRERFGSRLVER